MKQTFYLYLKIFIVIALIFSFIAIWDYSLIFGWLFSLLGVVWSAVLKYVILIRFIKNIVKYDIKFSWSKFLAYIFLSLFVFLGHSLIFVGIIFINHNFKNSSLDENHSIFLYPINIFSLLFGYIIFPISVIIKNSMLKNTY